MRVSSVVFIGGGGVCSILLFCRVVKLLLSTHTSMLVWKYPSIL